MTYDDQLTETKNEVKHYSDEFYKAALVITAIHDTSLDGFCGCGSDAEFGIVFHMLRAIDGQVEEPDECVREFMIPSRYDEVHKDHPYTRWGFPHTPISEFFAKFLDSKGLTEHGTTVVWSWLEEKGRIFLKAMDVCIHEYCTVNDLNEDEMYEGPYGYSTFYASLWWTEDEIYFPEWARALEQEIVVKPYVATDVAYRLFTGSDECIDSYHKTEEHIKEVDEMLTRILRIKARVKE